MCSRSKMIVATGSCGASAESKSGVTLGDPTCYIDGGEISAGVWQSRNEKDAYSKTARDRLKDLDGEVAIFIPPATHGKPGCKCDNNDNEAISQN